MKLEFCRAYHPAVSSTRWSVKPTKGFPRRRLACWLAPCVALCEVREAKGFFQQKKRGISQQILLFLSWPLGLWACAVGLTLFSIEKDMAGRQI